MELRRKSAVVLVLALILTLMPLQAFAEEDTAAGTASTDTTAADTTAAGEQTADTTDTEDTKPAAVKTGFYTIKGKLYYYEKTGKLTTRTGWQKINGAKYYGLGGGRFANKPTKIKTKVKVKKKVKVKVKKNKYKWKKKTVTVTKKFLYMFGTNGKLITKKGLYKYNGKVYYGLGKGKLKTKWAALKENNKLKAAYFNPKTGAMKKGGKVGYLKIPKSGRLGEAYALGVQKLDSTEWTLKQAYKNSYKIKYKDRWYRRKTSEKYAIRGFKNNNGNCFVMAATFYIQAKLLGYDVHQIKGKVAHIYPHSWTIIKEDGKTRVYDPNFRNETGRSGWKIWYGKKGTWRYTNKHKMN